MSPLLRRALPRIAAVMTALISVGAVVTILNAVESRSGLVWICVGGGLLVAGGSITLALARQTVWDRLAARAERWLQPQPRGEDAPVWGGVLIALGAIVYLAQLAVYFPQNDSYAGQDEEAFILTSAEVHDAGGALTLLPELYSGRFREANRHPLYLGMLALRPDFQSGKLLSVVLGCSVFVGVIVLGVRRRQWLRTGILCLLLGWNLAFARFSVIVGCEVLLAGIVGLYWLWLEVPADKTHGETPAAADWKLAAVSAVAVALAWLTKGTGLLLAAGCGLWLLVGSLRAESGDIRWSERGRWVHGVRVLAVFAVVWVVVASPLLTRNVLRFRHPFHNVNTWLLFVDEYQDPDQLSQSMTVAEAAAAYVGSHTWAEMAAREAQGLIWEVFVLLRSLGPPPWEDARVLPGAVLAALAIIGILVERRREQRLLVLWLLLCFPLFAWYVPIAVGERFIFPLVIPLLSCAADGGMHCLRWMRRASAS